MLCLLSVTNCSSLFPYLSNCCTRITNTGNWILKKMWINWSITRLVRWRVRDWASCFKACRFPMDGETDTYQSSQSQLPIRNVVFDVKDERTRHRNSKKLLGNKNRCRKINLSSTQVVSAENTSNINESRWPSFADEDYIVFCFREDGAFDVVKDCKSESSNRIDCTKRSSLPVNQKLTCDEDPVKRSNEDCHDIFPISDVEIIPVKEVDEEEEEESLCLDTELPSSRIIRRENQGMVSAGSSDSNQSENSTGSFAFPVLGWESRGSPAQWPKSVGLHLRKNKGRSLRFQCCRF